MLKKVLKTLEKATLSAFLEFGIEDIQPVFEHPDNPAYGDYSTNAALIAFGKHKAFLKKKGITTPLDLAKAIAESIKNSLGGQVDKVEVGQPGFVNIWFSGKMLTELLCQASADSRYGRGDLKSGKRIMIEYTDPNPFKQFHIGHLFSNTVGEALSRLFESQGATIKRANYQGDVGIHVACAIWGMQKKLEEKGMSFADLSKQSLGKRIEFLAQSYALGVKAYESSQKAKKQIRALNKKIYERSDKRVNKLYDAGKAWSLTGFEKIYKRLGTKFDFYYFESETGKKGLTLIKKHPEIFKREGKIWVFEGKKYGLHNRVFVNREGIPTYEVKDIGLAFVKYKDFPYDESYIITGNEVDEYFRVVLTVLKAIDKKLGLATHHISHGMVRLLHGKISSRTGNVLTGEWLLDETKKRLIRHYKMSDRIAEKVAVGAVKYALLRSKIGKDIVFDFDKVLSLKGDSGPYLQYTYARIQSVLSKVDTPPVVGEGRLVSAKNLSKEEIDILRYFYRFPKVVEEATKQFAPNILCAFLYELAQNYNSFYEKRRIIGGSRQDFRILLSYVVGKILENGLGILGIKAPEKM